MAWVQIDDFTEARIEGTAHRLTVCIDSVEVRGYDVAAGNPDDLVAALGEHLSGLAAPLVAQQPTVQPGEPDYVDAEIEGDDPADDDLEVGDGDRGRASDAVVRAWCTYWEVPCSKTGRLTQSARDAYERAGGGRPVDRTPFEDGARQPATDGHPAPAIVALGDGSEARRAEAVDPAGVDEAPIASAPREPDALTRAEELLEQKWTPRQVADAVGLELEEVRDLYRQLQGGARR